MQALSQVQSNDTSWRLRPGSEAAPATQPQDQQQSTVTAELGSRRNENHPRNNDELGRLYDCGLGPKIFGKPTIKKKKKKTVMLAADNTIILKQK